MSMIVIRYITSTTNAVKDVGEDIGRVGVYRDSPIKLFDVVCRNVSGWYDVGMLSIGYTGKPFVGGSEINLEVNIMNLN